MLDQLAGREEVLALAVLQAEGTMESTHELLDRSGVYAEYRSILTEYLGLLGDLRYSLEALKRIVFLAWYEHAEPSAFSGLWLLPPVMPRIYPFLVRRLFSPHPDSELVWMLPFYFSVADFAFPSLSKAPGLASFLASADSQAFLSVPPRERHFAGRGQMGSYWQSVFESHAVPADA
jgi:hypothetical protein